MTNKHIPKPPKSHPWKRQRYKKITMAKEDFDQFCDQLSDLRQPSQKILNAAQDLDRDGIQVPELGAVKPG